MKSSTIPRQERAEPGLGPRPNGPERPGMDSRLTPRWWCVCNRSRFLAWPAPAGYRTVTLVQPPSPQLTQAQTARCRQERTRVDRSARFVLAIPWRLAAPQLYGADLPMHRAE